MHSQWDGGLCRNKLQQQLLHHSIDDRYQQSDGGGENTWSKTMPRLAEHTSSESAQLISLVKLILMLNGRKGPRGICIHPSRQSFKRERK